METRSLTGNPARPIRTARSPADLLLVVAGAILFGWSLLVLVPAGTSWLWIGAILIGEWGHFAPVICLLMVWTGLRRGGRSGAAAAVLAGLAGLICCLPVARAAMIARALPARCTAAFGESGHPSRDCFSILNLFRGFRTGPVDVTTHVYGTLGTKELKLDLYQSKRHGAPQPLIVLIHGGSWNGGNKQQLPALNRYLASQGYAVAAIDYRHAPKWPFPAAVDDLFRAVEFLQERATAFGIDGNRIVLIGRSAGGQIALSAAYAERNPAIRGVVSFYAPSDLVRGYEQPSAPGILDSRRVLEDYLGGTPAQKPALYAAASPINFANASAPPTLLIHGGLDPIVSPAHSELLGRRLDQAARPNLYVALPWATHGCDANLAGPSGQLSLYAIERFLPAVF